MSESLPVMAQKGSYKIDVEAGKSYWWCACGKSGKQPFLRRLAQGHHVYADEVRCRAGRHGVVLRLRKQSGNAPPRCDGSHNRLP